MRGALRAGPAPWVVAGGLLVLSMALSLSALQAVVVRPSLGAPLLAGTAVAGALALRPAWLVPGFVALTWAAIQTRLFSGLASPVELGGLVLLGIAAWRVANRRGPWADVLTVVALLGLPLVVTGLLAPESPGVSLHAIREVGFVAIAGLCIASRADLERAVLALVAVGAVLGAGAAVSVLSGPFSVFSVVSDSSVTGPGGAAVAVTSAAAAGAGPFRAAGPFGEPNFFALSLAALIPLAALVAARRGPARLLGLVALACLPAGVLATGSRGGVIAALAGLLVLAACSGGRVRLAAAATLLAAGAAVPLFLGQAAQSGQRTTSGRATENRIAVAMFADRPAAGVGPGHFPALYRDYSRRIGNDPRVGREPHSLPLEIAAEQGAIGLLGWLAAAVLVARRLRGRRLWRDPTGGALIAATVAYGTGSLFLHGSDLRLPFLLVGMLLAAAWLADRAEVVR
jgi:O-antigen ligase